METWLILEYANRGCLQVQRKAACLRYAKCPLQGRFSSCPHSQQCTPQTSCKRSSADVCAGGGVAHLAHNNSAGGSIFVVQQADGAVLHTQNGIDRGWFQAEKATHGRGRPALPVLLHTARTIAAGMAYLHSRDIIHGDLCGGNVLLTVTDALPHRFTAKASSELLSRRG